MQFTGDGSLRSTKYSQEIKDLKSELRKLERENVDRNQLIAMKNRIDQLKKADKDFQATYSVKKKASDFLFGR